MLNCLKCGEEVRPGTRFCKHCGTRLESSLPASDNTLPEKSPPLSGGSGKSKAVRIAALSTVAVIVVIAVVLVLAFTVFNGSEEVKGDPQETVEEIFQAIEDGDATTIASLLAPELIKQLEDSYLAGMYGSQLTPGLEQVFSDLEDYGYDPEKAISFRGLAFETEIDGKRATVSVTSGFADTTFGYWTTEEDLVSDLSCPIVFYLDYHDAKWLVSDCSLLDYLDDYRESFEEMYEDTH